MQNSVDSGPRPARAALLSALLLGLCAGPAMAAEDCRHGIPPSTPSAAFVDHGDGTATHAATGLMWKRCSEGQTWREAGCDGEAAAYPWAEALALASGSDYAGHDDWRLPNVKELVRLVEHCRIVPAVNTEMFPATPGGRFWTGTPSAATVGTTWYVDFEFGPSHGGGYRSEALHVRLVREAATSAPQEADGGSPQHPTDDAEPAAVDADAGAARDP